MINKKNELELFFTANYKEKIFFQYHLDVIYICLNVLIIIIQWFLKMWIGLTEGKMNPTLRFRILESSSAYTFTKYFIRWLRRMSKYLRKYFTFYLTYSYSNTKKLLAPLWIFENTSQSFLWRVIYIGVKCLQLVIECLSNILQWNNNKEAYFH